MNISCRYHEGKDRMGNEFTQHPLGEGQENKNACTKQILLGPDKLSWKVHSPNVACAHMCVSFEESEYVKGDLDYSEINKAKTKRIHQSTRTVVPSALLEEERMYKWCVLMFNIEVTNHVCLVSDGYIIINN